MAKYPRLTDPEIREGIEETKKSIEGSKAYLRFLSTGRGLPRDLLSRQELAESHSKLICKSEEMVEDLEAELHDRAKGVRK